MNKEHLSAQLERQEGCKKFVYKCSAGFLTVGIGRNLETKGLSDEEALYLLNNDIDDIYSKLSKYDWFMNLNDIRQNVIINMCFQMGVNGFLKFTNLITAIKIQNDTDVSKEMKDSEWYRRYTTRATEMIKQWVDNP